jgi:hypothetical protein
MSVAEPQYRRASKRIRPFAQSAKVSHRGCSRPLQRAVTDFGADQAFAQVMDKLVEHYGIILNESSIRRITESHAQKIFEATNRSLAWPTQRGRSAVVIVEMDGGMVPTVEPDAAQSDRRKGKKLQWKEAKICLAHPQGSKTLAYGGTLQGALPQPENSSSSAPREPDLARAPVFMRWEMARNGSPIRSKTNLERKVATCWTSTMCAITWTRPPKPSSLMGRRKTRGWTSKKPDSRHSAPANSCERYSRILKAQA